MCVCVCVCVCVYTPSSFALLLYHFPGFDSRPRIYSPVPARFRCTARGHIAYCVCACVCIYIYIYTHTHTHTHTHAHTHTIYIHRLHFFYIIFRVSILDHAFTARSPPGSVARPAATLHIVCARACVYIYIYTHTHTHTHTQYALWPRAVQKNLAGTGL